MSQFNSDLAGQMNDRVTRMEKLQAAGINPFANDFHVVHTVKQVVLATTAQELKTQEELLPTDQRWSVAGRLVQASDLGKIKFLFIRGDENQIVQGLIRKNDDPASFELTKDIQTGDIVGFSGPLFKTKQGKPAILVEKIRLLTKALRPLPGKILQEEQDVKDIELLYRQRYFDLIQHPAKADVFRSRAKIISTLRRLLDDNNFVEVETRMMLATNGGASARPFETHHNALDKDFYLRIAPELDLKRCVVGGMERVYEIGRQFRNEGMDRFHNPEFTSLEFYRAYSDYENAMEYVEYLLRNVACALYPETNGVFKYQDTDINMNHFARKTMLDAVLEVLPDLPDDSRHGMKLVEVFEQCVESTLIQPTFITQYPIEASPLARRNESDPRFTDRFELFICGKEVANGFSELNDPIDQYNRFAEQARQKASGNEEAMDLDEDYIVALQYGMPPCAGVGIGIDRLVMFLANQQSIRDVILFPQMR